VSLFGPCCGIAFDGGNGRDQVDAQHFQPWSGVCSDAANQAGVTRALAQTHRACRIYDTALAMNDFHIGLIAGIAITVPGAAGIADDKKLSVSMKALGSRPPRSQLGSFFRNMSDAASPMQMPAPVITTDLPSRRPMVSHWFVLRRACRAAEFQTDLKRPKSI